MQKANHLKSENEGLVQERLSGLRYVGDEFIFQIAQLSDLRVS